jgi:hypothetical protein
VLITAVGKWQSFILYHLDLKIRFQVSGVRREERKSGNPKPHMKLNLLIQKCSFFLIKLAAFQASGGAEH